MKCKVYRALDKPQVFFGIKGRFITWYLILAGVVLMLAVIIGAAKGHQGCKINGVDVHLDSHCREILLYQLGCLHNRVI